MGELGQDGHMPASATQRTLRGTHTGVRAKGSPSATATQRTLRGTHTGVRAKGSPSATATNNITMLFSRRKQRTGSKLSSTVTCAMFTALLVSQVSAMRSLRPVKLQGLK